ncbi:MAG: hypothetical protein LBL45_04940 [Treponema sp.]|jgi:hypothetical protein|nr:hypothetical protein [Treponema sp.]
MAERKRPRWESEGMLGCSHVTDKIVCKTCIFRYNEIGGEKVEAPKAEGCEIYEYPESKPDEVYFDGAECENYEKDE